MACHNTYTIGRLVDISNQKELITTDRTTVRSHVLEAYVYTATFFGQCKNQLNYYIFFTVNYMNHLKS